MTTALFSHSTALYVQPALALRPVQGGLDMLGILEGFEGPGSTGPHETQATALSGKRGKKELLLQKLEHAQVLYIMSTVNMSTCQRFRWGFCVY